MRKSPLLDVVPAGVLNGDQCRILFDYAKEHNFAILAVNITSSSTANAALEAARDIGAPIIIQVDNDGATSFAGQGLPNDQLQATILGAITAAHHVRAVAPSYGIPVVMHSDHCPRSLLPWLDGMLSADEAYFATHHVPLFTSHMLDLSVERKHANIATCVEYFSRMARVGLWLEMEIGITGGEEAGVNNSGVDNALLYTQPADVYDVYNALSAVGPNFSIAASFGNVHGVYKPGNVRLQPELLAEHQAYTAARQITKGAPRGPSTDKPLYLVFHGGSGSTQGDIKTAVSHGVIKMNMNTDTQFAYLSGIRKFIAGKIHYLMAQVGNPDGGDLPNKKYYDPRVWVREGEMTMKGRVIEACNDLGFVSTRQMGSDDQSLD